jgi:hypothetical protein
VYGNIKEIKQEEQYNTYNLTRGQVHNAKLLPRNTALSSISSSTDNWLFGDSMDIAVSFVIIKETLCY